MPLKPLDGAFEGVDFMLQLQSEADIVQAFQQRFSAERVYIEPHHLLLIGVPNALGLEVDGQGVAGGLHRRNPR